MIWNDSMSPSDPAESFSPITREIPVTSSIMATTRVNIKMGILLLPPVAFLIWGWYPVIAWFWACGSGAQAWLVGPGGGPPIVPGLN